MNSPRGKRASSTCHFVAAISRFVDVALRSRGGGVAHARDEYLHAKLETSKLTICV